MTVIKRRAEAAAKAQGPEGDLYRQSIADAAEAKTSAALAAAAKERERRAARSPAARAIEAVIEIVNGMTLQTLLYLGFVAVFQLLTSCIRAREEFYLDKHVMDRLVENHFDSSHNTFESIRRPADIWEWGNNVRYCTHADVGAPGACRRLSHVAVCLAPFPGDHTCESCAHCHTTFSPNRGHATRHNHCFGRVPAQQ